MLAAFRSRSIPILIPVGVAAATFYGRVTSAQDPDIIYVGGNAADRCESGWVVLRLSVTSDYDEGNWDMITGRAQSATTDGISQRANKPAPPEIRRRGLAEIDRKLAEVRAGNIPSDLD